MTLAECAKRKNMVAHVGLFSAAIAGFLVTLAVGYYTVYDGAISAINAVFHTKSAEQFVWGALRFWFGFAVSSLSGCFAAVGVLRIFSPLEHYYMRKFGEIRKGRGENEHSNSH